MGHKQLKRIVLSDFKNCYHVGGYCDMEEDALLELNIHVPRNTEHLKGYLTGLLTFMDNEDTDSYLSLIYNIKNSKDSPLDEAVYQEVTDFIKAWS